STRRRSPEETPILAGGSMNERRVVVTGLGMVSPLGLTAAATWEGIVAGRSGIGPITAFDSSAYASRIAGELPGFDPHRYIDRKEAKRMDRFCQEALAAAIMAAEDARLPINDETRFDIGVLIGSGIGG